MVQHLGLSVSSTSLLIMQMLNTAIMNQATISGKQILNKIIPKPKTMQLNIFHFKWQHFR